ncbi:MAG: UvrD-helicase domain-containing protein [Bacteroidales bacterium]|nr:UvrD-helicase domain-containing protein [Bacteroidales bacterium]
MLTVYKASAGSGKTFHLVYEYLKLIISNPYNYRHILAVTFTNKAANEMKIRILRQLFLLSGNKDSDYLEMLKESLIFDEDKIRLRASKALKNILHDYGRFAVNTIDSFTQRIIRAFNRETGISPQFTLGMEDEMILNEATDRMLSGIDTDRNLRKWLVEFSKEKIMDNFSHKIEDDIRALGNELFKEKFQVFFPHDKDSEYTRDNLETVRKELKRYISYFDNALKDRGEKGVEIIFAGGLTIDDFSGKSRGIGNVFSRLASGDLPEITNTVTSCAEDSEKWYAKSSKQKEKIFSIVETQLRPLLIEIIRFRNDNEPKYLAAKEVLSRIRVLGILTDLREEIKNLLHEKGILQISDSNLLLSKIIGETDTPFIYEKTGNWFKYYIIDEFQDTSALQWNNFKPLIANALSEGYSALVAGDVKQSIYRWRNSDWNILAFKINTDFPHYPPFEIPLEKNWRSSKNIIRFNNEVTGHIKCLFEEFILTEIEDEKYIKRFAQIYEHFLQQPGNSQAGTTGLAGIKLLPSEDFDNNSVDLLLEQVKYLQDKGIKASDTAILIRKNKEGPRIIEKFLAASNLPGNERYNLSVISGESLFLSVSKGVNMVMLTVSLLTEPENMISKTALLHFWLSWLKPRLNQSGIFPADASRTQNNPGESRIVNDTDTVFEAELGPILKELKEKLLLLSPEETVSEICNLFGLFSIKSEIPFLQTLLDKAAEEKATFSNDLTNLLLWWNEEGYKVSVSVNQDVDAVRLLTVHKAKGLEFEAVILPFFNWETSWPSNRAPILWCRADIDPFNRFPLVPVKAGKKLLKTVFRDDYIEEKVNSYIDSFNLVYVAFTRARSVLFVNCKDPFEKSDRNEMPKPPVAFNSLLVNSLDRMALDSKFADSWNDDKTEFRFGHLPPVEGQKEIIEPDWPGSYHFYDYRDRIRLRLKSEDFLINGEKNKPVKNAGKLVHEILENVEVADDFRKSCNKAFAEGKISESEQAGIIKKFEEGLKNPLVGEWFNGKYQILNERNLLTKDKILRPDRIMIKGRKALIVDYKWGDKMTERYHRQIKRYAGTLKKCGFDVVEGYIWYLNLNEAEKVGEW